MKPLFTGCHQPTLTSLPPATFNKGLLFVNNVAIAQKKRWFLNRVYCFNTQFLSWDTIVNDGTV